VTGEAEGPVRVSLLRLPEALDLASPERASAHAAGFDLRARLDVPLTLDPGERALVPTGVALALPEGYEGQLRPRSGLALRQGLTLLNSPGTVDSDYRGEIAVLLINLGREPISLRRGDRIAQLVVHKLPAVVLTEVEALPSTPRGSGGFGHTGRH
jgi:dUTP pyrophosphatase